MNVRALVGVSLLAASMAACTSLLGDFTVGSAAQDGGGGDAGDDMSIGDGTASEGGNDGGMDSTGSDAAGDSGIPLVTMKCTSLKLAQPFQIASLTGDGGSSMWGLATFPISATKTRVVAGRSGADIFSVYEVDASVTPPAVTSLDVPVGSNVSGNTGTVSWAGRLQSGFGVTVSYTDNKGFEDLDLYVFPNASSIATVPTPIRLYHTTATTTQSSSVLEVSPQEYFVTAVVTNGNDELLAGLSTGGAEANMSMVDTGAAGFTSPVSVQVGNSVYVYLTGSSGPAFYTLSATGTTFGMRTAIPRATTDRSLGEVFLDAVPGSAANTTNLAYLEFDVNDAGTGLSGINFSTAPVAYSKLPTLTISDIAFGRTYTDFGSVPGLSYGGMGFYGDDFVAVGPGSNAPQDGTATAWVNFLWLDMHGVVRGEQVGTNGILQGLGPLSQDGVTFRASPGPRSAQLAAWNLFWIQTNQIVMYDELDCTP